MPLELRWLASMSTSCFHACGILLQNRPLVDPVLATALTDPCMGLGKFFSSQRFPQVLLLEHLTALSAGIDNNTELARLSLVKTVGKNNFGASTLDTLALIITDLERAIREAYPAGLDELLLRGGPLSQQWEARGPGLWNQLSRLVGNDVLVERADLVLVHPALGGGGAAHLQYNSVHFEAVLANPHMQLPEVLRLGWLLAQLNLDLPMYRDNIPNERRARVAALAMIPPILMAAEEVELAHCDPRTLQTAIDAWQITEASPGTLAATLINWWDTTRNTGASWQIALPALDQMLAMEA